MPATDNKYPITYDGVDPATILPSFNPYEGYPIKRTSSSSNLSCVAIIRGDDEHPYLSSTIATQLLAKVSDENPSLNKTGFAFLGSDFNSSGISNGLVGGQQALGFVLMGENWNISGVLIGSVSSGGITYSVSSSSDLIESTLTYGSIVSLDEVFYSIYIKNYLINEGIYYPLMGKNFGNWWRSRNSRVTSLDNINGSLSALGTTTGITSNNSYRGWLDTGVGTSAVESKWFVSSATSLTETETSRLGAIEGWHAIPSTHKVYGVLINISSGGSSSLYLESGTATATDRYSGIGLGDLSNYSISTSGASHTRLLLVYAAPYRPRNQFKVLRYDGVSYNEESLDITQNNQNYDGQSTINLAKEISVSPNGKYIFLATESGNFNNSVAKLKNETLFLFKYIYTGPGYTWRNAFLETGLIPTSAQTSDAIGGSITLTEKKGFLSCGSGLNQFAFNNGQYSKVLVTDSANWLATNNIGYIAKSQMTSASTKSSITAPLQGSEYPCAPFGISKNGLQIANPTAGQEIGGAGSPTIAIDVSNTGVVVKADRNTNRGFKRIAISGASGSSVTLSQNHGLSTIYFNTYVTFDINQGGSLPVGTGITAGVGYKVTIVSANTLNITGCTFSSAGTSAYLIIYDGDEAINRYGQTSMANSRSSNFNINSYQNNVYATVTIDGQQVLASSPITLETARYGAFGSAVAINDDGDTVAVSSPSEGYSETSGEQPLCEGAVYIYKKLQGEGGGQVWAQTNRITVPRTLSYQSGATGYNPHAQFGSSLEFSGTNLLVGSRQGVYIYELAIGLFANIQQKTTITSALSFATPLELYSNTQTKTNFDEATLSNCSIPFSESISTNTQIVVDLENPVKINLSETISTSTNIEANLTYSRKVTLATRVSCGTAISPYISLLNSSIASNTSARTTLAVTTSGGAGILCNISCSGSYSASLIRFVNILATTASSTTLGISDNLLRINPYEIGASVGTFTAFSANLGYILVELQAQLNKSTRFGVSVAKLTTLGTTDVRQASIFEAGRPGAVTIGGLSQRWVKRSDLQNNDLTTSVEWVEGQPPQLD